MYTSTLALFIRDNRLKTTALEMNFDELAGYIIKR